MLNQTAMKMLRKDVIGNMEERTSNFAVFKDLIPLFAVELVILTLLNFANLSTIYRIMAIVLMAMAIVPIIKSLPREKSVIPLLMEVGALFLYFLLSCTFGQLAYNNFLIITSLVLGALSFFTLGCYYGLFKDKKTSFKNILSAIYIGIGAFSLLSLIVTIYGMGVPFHAIHFANPKYSNQIALIEQARIIIDIFMDLDFVSAVPNQFGVAFLGNFAILASTGIYVALFTNQKENKFLWYGSLLGGLCGVATMLLIPIVFGLVLFILGLITCLLIRFKNKKTKLYFIIFGSVVLLALIGYLVFRIDYRVHRSNYANMNYVLKVILTQQIGFTKYVSNTKFFLTEVKPAFIGSFIPKDYSYITSGNLLVDVLYQSGILPLIMIIVFFGTIIYELIKYIKNDDDFNIKIGVTTLSIFFGITLLINYVGLLLVENFVFLGMLMVFGYMTAYNIKHKKLNN